jgi:hypothetical protein
LIRRDGVYPDSSPSTPHALYAAKPVLSIFDTQQMSGVADPARNMQVSCVRLLALLHFFHFHGILFHFSLQSVLIMNPSASWPTILRHQFKNDQSASNNVLLRREVVDALWPCADKSDMGRSLNQVRNR